MCSLDDSNNGWYSVSYCLTTAGKFTISLALGGSSSVTTYDGTCTPAATDPGRCVVSDVETSITAGQVAKLRITRYDR